MGILGQLHTCVKVQGREDLKFEPEILVVMMYIFSKSEVRVMEYILFRLLDLFLKICDVR